MLDLRNIPDEDFSIVVTAPTTRPVLQVTINESGMVLLSSKLATQIIGKTVQLSFNPNYTAMQIICTQATSTDNCFVFPKNGRKKIEDIQVKLKKARIPFLAVYRGILVNAEKWRGERQANPTGKPSETSRTTRKK